MFNWDPGRASPRNLRPRTPARCSVEWWKWKQPKTTESHQKLSQPQTGNLKILFSKKNIIVKILSSLEISKTVYIHMSSYVGVSKSTPPASFTPMKINGWKMIFPFEMIPFQVTCSFSRGKILNLRVFKKTWDSNWDLDLDFEK